MNYFQTLPTLPKYSDVGLTTDDFISTFKEVQLGHSTPNLDDFLGFDRTTGQYNNLNGLFGILNHIIYFANDNDLICYMDKRKWKREYLREIGIIFEFLMPLLEVRSLEVDKSNMFKNTDHSWTHNHKHHTDQQEKNLDKNNAVSTHNTDNRFQNLPQHQDRNPPFKDTSTATYLTANGDVSTHQSTEIIELDNEAITQRNITKDVDVNDNMSNRDRDFDEDNEADDIRIYVDNNNDIISKKEQMVKIGQGLITDISIYDRLNKFFHMVGIGYEYD